MTLLPIELFDILIDILKHDRPTLNALSLTHPLLTPLAQKRIFAHIALSGEQDDVDNANSILVALTHNQHQHLLPYVRGLTLTNDIQRRNPAINTDYVPNHLIPAFIDAIAPHLSSLILRGFAPGWDHDASTPLRNAIARLLSSPKLTHLDLDGVNKFPIVLLNRPSSLTHFRFATPYPSHAQVPDTAIPGAPQIYLDTLDINLWGENAPRSFIDWILGDSPSSRLSVARLRSLSINGAYTRQVALSIWRLLDACHSTLRHLSFGPDSFSHDNGNTLHHLNTLHSLQLRTLITYQTTLLTSNPTPFNFLIYVLTNLSSPSALRRLDIVVRYEWRGNSEQSYENMDMSAWETLASFVHAEVQNGKFSQLKNIGVGVTTLPTSPDIVNPENIFPMIREKLATIAETFAITIEFYESV